MMSSTTPLAEPQACHPVHRANAMLRQALLSSTSTAPDPAEIWGDRTARLEPAPIDLAYGPVGITTPEPLTALRDLVISDAPAPACQHPVTDAPEGATARPSLEDAPEGDDMLDDAVQQQLRAMIQAFHRRQRQASLLVAYSVIAAVVLTLSGLILLFSLTGPAPDGRLDAAPKDASSAGRTAQQTDIPRVQANTVAKDAPLLVRAKAEPSLGAAGAGARILHAEPGRPLALGPLLPVGSARYLLLRGLPETATLSVGRQTRPGTWMVKGEDVAGLALTLGAEASGDYPTEAYLLGAEDGPQARRRLVLRVDPSPKIYAAGQTNPDLETLHERARSLLGTGDIATARRLLTELAEHGHADAAYELALTYDREILVKAGLDSIEGDMETAQAWYAYAARQDHAGAAQRLQTFAKRRAGA